MIKIDPSGRVWVKDPHSRDSSRHSATMTSYLRPEELAALCQSPVITDGLRIQVIRQGVALAEIVI